MHSTLASDAVIDTAYAWLCRQRRHWSADTDVWDLLIKWPTTKQNIQQALADTLKAFATPPLWCADLPVYGEGEISQTYVKP